MASTKERKEKAMILKDYTKKQLTERITRNRAAIRETSDVEEQRRLIEENHLMLTELDAREFAGIDY